MPCKVIDGIGSFKKNPVCIDVPSFVSLCLSPVFSLHTCLGFGPGFGSGET